MKEKLMRFTIITALVLFAFIVSGFLVSSPKASASIAKTNIALEIDSMQKLIHIDTMPMPNCKDAYSVKSKHFIDEQKNENQDTGDVNLQKKRELRKQLIEEVKRYIQTRTAKANEMLAEHLVDNALEHNIQLCFMMAQTEIETCYGVTGAGRPSSRRSLFGVVKRHYSNYDNAIDDWCKLVKKSYMGSRKTEEDLMRNYVTLGGARYCSGGGYERKLRSTYGTIKRNTKIDELESQLKSLRS